MSTVKYYEILYVKIYNASNFINETNVSDVLNHKMSRDFDSFHMGNLDIFDDDVI